MSGHHRSSQECEALFSLEHGTATQRPAGSEVLDPVNDLNGIDGWRRARDLLRTALASVLFVLLSHAAAQWLTRDYQVWTAEGARRLQVAVHPVAAPHTVMEGPDVQGRTLHALLADGRSVTIVDFMYTRCLAVCAVLGSVFQQLQSAIRDDEHADGAVPLRLLSISIDPGHDDASAMRTYGAGLSADPLIWRFAGVADAAHLKQLLDRFEVTVIPDGRGGYEHNAGLLVIDPHGRMRHVFDYGELETALAFARWLGEGESQR